MRIQSSHCVIRPVTPGDLDAVLGVYRQCEDFLALGPQPRASMAMVEADLKISADEGGIYCGVFDPDGGLIGVVDFVPCRFDGDPQRAFLSLLMVAAPQRGKGLGAEIVQLIEAEIAQDAGVTVIESGVQVNNPAALRFWQRMGYDIAGGPERLPDQTTVFHLRKVIQPDR
ncbi:MAG: GNAT family N-acetyltransferase [Chloroflexi bacterium]|nr:GNAT family N-acetyltransferase [Chloroflexota bacterium]